MNLSPINYQSMNVFANIKQQNRTVNFRGKKGDVLVKMLEKNKGTLSPEQLQGFMREHIGRFGSKKTKDVLESLLPYIAGISATSAGLLVANKALESDKYNVERDRIALEERQETLKSEIENFKAEKNEFLAEKSEFLAEKNAILNNAKEIDSRNTELALQIDKMNKNAVKEEDKVALTQTENEKVQEVYNKQKEAEKNERIKQEALKIKTKYRDSDAANCAVAEFLIKNGYISVTGEEKESSTYSGYEGPCDKHGYDGSEPGSYPVSYTYNHTRKKLSNGGIIWAGEYTKSYWGPDPILAIK